MSFIYGIINLNGEPVKKEAINALAKGVKWEGFTEHVETGKNFAIGYCYHPERAPKAGIFQNDDVLILADIRIYNDAELRKSFESESPVEAFAKAFVLWGVQCANRINGDFAVIVIDRKKNEVHLFRDATGTRPLTYCFDENQLIFASHQFGIVKSGLVTTSLSEEKLINEIFWFKGDYTQTIFRKLFKVIPGYCFSFSPHRKLTVKYWKPEEIKQNKSLTFEAAVIRLRQLIVSATLSRMESDKTGVHVSGGLDSTGVASILADHTKDKSQLMCYSWSPEELDVEFEGVDEKELIELFSADKGIPVKYLRLDEDESVKDGLLPEFEHMHIEHPIMKRAGTDGVKTLFSGWGGDEFVSMSTRGTYNHLFFQFKWLQLMKIILKKGIKSGIVRLRTEVLPLLLPFGLLHTYQPIDWSNLRSLKPAFILKHWKSIFFHKRKNFFGYGNRTRFMLNLLENYHLAERMESWAIHAERYGFEYKYPLLDKELLEFWFSIPIEYTYRDMAPRLLYREAMKGILTEEIRLRKDKDEGQFQTYNQQNRRKGEKFIKDLFMAIPEKEHLLWFRPETIQKAIDQAPDKKLIKNIRRQNKPVTYLRYFALVKKYLT